MFKKWPEIENSYRQKFIDKFLAAYPQLLHEDYAITEKIHGANLQLYFVPGESYRVGTRNRFLNPGDKFYNVWETLALPRYQILVTELQNWADHFNATLRVFGEYYGKGVQKGVSYEDRGHHDICIFGHMVDNVLVSPFETSELILIDCSLTPDYLVPPIYSTTNLQDALDFDTAIPSKLGSLDTSNNVMEGVVIRPYYVTYRLPDGPYFILKKKNEAFKERHHAPKSRPTDDQAARVNDIFRGYITDARMQGIFSKMGPIEAPQQLGNYIRAILEDAKEDFLKDYTDEFNQLDKSQQRAALNIGSLIANMLKDFLRTGG